MKRLLQLSRYRDRVAVGSSAGLIACAAIAGLTVSLPSAAHHSFSAEFDSTKEIRATGALTELEWMNPHAWIHIQVTELCERTAAQGRDAEPEDWNCRTPSGDEGADWAFEMGSPNGLMRQGWSRNSLQPGDIVTISGTRARDGSTNSNARSVTTADGKRMFAGSSENETP